MEKNTGLVLLLLCGCVSGTPYQRAMRLQQRDPAEEEIVQALSDPNWKIRCLAARACGASVNTACLQSMRELAAKDADERVQACFMEALALRCEADGRDLLAGIVWSDSASPGDLVATAYAEAVTGCPSADAAFTLATARGSGFKQALETIAPGARWTELEGLEGLAKLAPPRSRVKTALRRRRAEIEDVRGAAQLAKAKEAARAEAAELEAETRRAAALEAAAAAIQSGEFDRAERLIVVVQDLGADGAALRAMLDAGRKSASDEHLKKARQLLREQKVLAAEVELRAAESLGGTDEKLSKAIAGSPEVRQREAEARRKELEGEIDELVETHLSAPVEGAFEVTDRNEDFFGAVSSSDVVAFGETTSGVWRERLRAAQGAYQREVVERAMRQDRDLAALLKAVRRRLAGATFSMTDTDSHMPVWLGDRFFVRLFDEEPELPVERIKYYYHPNSVLLNEHGHFRCRRLRGLPEEPWGPGACGLDLDGLPRKLMAIIENRNHSWRWLWTGLGAERRLWMQSNPWEPTRTYSVKSLRVELRDQHGALLWTFK
jgi:hypothetical protein